MRGETRRKARRRYPGDEALRRVSPRRRRERRRRERERGRAPEHRAELPRVPSGALFRAEAGRNLSGRGGFDRTAARRHICICRAVARTEKPPAQKGEHGCPKQSRTLSGKPAQHRKPTQDRQRFRSSALYMQEDSESSTVNGPSLRRRTFMSAPKRPVPTRSEPSAARRSATKRS